MPSRLTFFETMVLLTALIGARNNNKKQILYAPAFYYVCKRYCVSVISVQNPSAYFMSCSLTYLELNRGL
jgi:hypothetical protein